MFKLFKVVIEIEDLNDNSPIFPKSIIDVNLSEEAQLGHLLRLGKHEKKYGPLSIIVILPRVFVLHQTALIIHER